MKITLELPSGLRIDFEGDAQDFKQFTAFLSNDLPGFLETPDPIANESASALAITAAEPTEQLHPLDARNVLQRLEEVGAASDIERVTVMAQLAVDAGQDGIDYPTVRHLYDQLGFRKPAQIAKTFQNARARNLVTSAGYGLWRPTIPGENYARGHGRKDAPRRRAVGGSRAQRSLIEGDDDD